MSRLLTTGILQQAKNNLSGWTPIDLADLAAWYDASDATTITESGGAVSQLDDKSGNAYNLTQATGSARPNYNAVDDVIEFNGTSDFLQGGDILSNPNDAIIIFAIKNQMAYKALSQLLISYRLNGGTELIQIIINNNTLNSFSFQVRGSSNVITQATSTETLTNGMIIGIRFSKSNVQELRFNGDVASLQNDSFIGQTISSTETLFGAFRGVDTIHTGFAEMDFAECVISLESSELNAQKIEGYLAHKWSLTAGLPAGHPYKTVAP